MASHADSPSAHTVASATPGAMPSLPPSVEEAYRRKCIQLKQRTAEVEEANDAARLRLARLSRQAEKMRIERAFLLEQLAKRTSANVEDSDGSPSPPPTPKEKPLRTKRGHRKLSAIPDVDPNATPGSTFINQTGAGPSAGSPASESFSHAHADATASATSARANGTAREPKKPSNAFDMYCSEVRPTFEAKLKDGDDKDKGGIDAELARGWTDLPEAERESFQARADDEMAKYYKEKDEYEKKNAKTATVKVERAAEDAPATGGGGAAGQDEDVEMTNYDTEPEAEATPSAAGGGEKD